MIDAKPHELEIVRKILQQYIPAKTVLVFGSRASGGAKKFSDLDLAIIGDEPLSVTVQTTLKEAFDESMLPYKVDIVDWHTITESFRNVIQQSSIKFN